MSLMTIGLQSRIIGDKHRYQVRAGLLGKSRVVGDSRRGRTGLSMTIEGVELGY